MKVAGFNKAFVSGLMEVIIPKYLWFIRKLSLSGLEH